MSSVLTPTVETFDREWAGYEVIYQAVPRPWADIASRRGDGRDIWDSPLVQRAIGPRDIVNGSSDNVDSAVDDAHFGPEYNGSSDYVDVGYFDHDSNYHQPTNHNHDGSEGPVVLRTSVESNTHIRARRGPHIRRGCQCQWRWHNCRHLERTEGASHLLFDRKLRNPVPRCHQVDVRVTVPRR